MQIEESPGRPVERSDRVSQRFILLISKQLLEWNGNAPIFAVRSGIFQLETGGLGTNIFWSIESKMRLHKLHRQSVGALLERQWQGAGGRCVSILPMMTQ